MSYRDIIVQMDDLPPSKARAEIAVGLAEAFGAQVIGAFLRCEFVNVYPVTDPFLYVAPADYDMLRQGHEDAVLRAAEKARDVFERAATMADVASDWRLIAGDDQDALVGLARRSDLTILPRRVNPTCTWREISAASVAMASGGPVLVVPPEPSKTAIGRHVMVAWNGARESARALRDAWPFIHMAKQVSVLCVSSDGPDSDLQRHFERHGVVPDLIVDRSEGADAADVLLRQVGALGVDLVVMGAYGHARLQELVLGGVSRRMLQDCPVSLLMAH